MVWGIYFTFEYLELRGPLGFSPLPAYAALLRTIYGLGQSSKSNSRHKGLLQV